MLGPFIILGIIGLAVPGFLVAVFLRVAAHWVAKIEIPFGKAFGLAITINLLVGVLGFIIKAGLSGGNMPEGFVTVLNGVFGFIAESALSAGNTPRWLPFAVSYCMGVAVAGAMLCRALPVRFGKGALIYLFSTLLGYGIIAATLGVCACFI